MKYPATGIAASNFKPLTILGDSSAKASFVSSLSGAEADCLTFYSGEDPTRLASIGAGIVVAPEQLQSEIQGFNSRAIVWSPHPKYTFIKALQDFCTDKFTDDTLHVPSQEISKAAYVETDAQLGEQVEVYPNATIFSCASIGEGSIIQAGSVIGGNGLGDVFYEGKYHRFVHLGGVDIAKNVSIGVNSTVLRGMLEDTVIGEGTRIGNNVNIGHSSNIGKNVYISSGVTIGGACVIEDNCWISPGVATTDHITIGKNSKIGTGSVVIKDALEDSFYLGNPARKLPSKS